MTYEQLDRSIDADSDSDDELAAQAHLYRSRSSSHPACFAFGLYRSMLNLSHSGHRKGQREGANIPYRPGSWDGGLELGSEPAPKATSSSGTTAAVCCDKATTPII
jgi:hypothetical protein